MWGIYGATGYTGRMIAAEAVRRGHRPVLLGRSRESLQERAREYGLDSRQVSTTADVISAMADIDLVVNAAGPFDETVGPVFDACLATRTNYLDLSNELEPVRRILDRDFAARDSGITAIPAVGFGTVATEAAALHALAGCPDAVSIDVALLADNAGGGAGTTASVFAVLASGGARLTNGNLERSRLGVGITRVRTPLGRRSLVAVATGDIATVEHTTSISTVSASVAFTVPAGLLAASLPVVSAIVRTGVLRARSRKPAKDHVYRSYAWARARDSAGGSSTSWLESGEGYAFTASSVVSAVEETLRFGTPGARSSGSAFGPEFALRVPGTQIHSLDAAGAVVAAS